MLSADETAELRMLQAKAYGPDGGITAAELDRLRELNPVRLRSAAVAEGAATPEGAPDRRLDAGLEVGAVPETSGLATGAGPETAPRTETDPDPELRTTTSTTSSNESDASNADHPQASASTEGQPWRRHPLAFAVAASIALVLGVGIGWILFGRDTGPGIPITAEQQVRGEQLAEESNLDAGSILPMAEDDDVLVWVGTRDSGEITCMIIEDGEHDAPSCAPTQSIAETGLYGMLSRDAPAGSLEDAPENATEMISASMGFVREDEPVVMIQRGWSTSGTDYLDQFTDSEQRATAERLLDDGLDEWSPMLAAYDGDTQIWIGTRESGQQACIYYGGGPDASSVCGPIGEAQTDGMTMMVPYRVGETPSSVSVTLRYTDQMIASVVITRDADASGAPVGPGSGDPIEFTFEDPTHDDLVSEGETGETPR